MFFIVTFVSIFTIAVGVLGLGAPARLVYFVSRWFSQMGLWSAIALRLIFGIALWMAATASRSPVGLKILAIISILSAIVFPVMGVSRFQALLNWWSRQSPAFIRLWSLFAIFIGVYILWAVS